MEFPTYQDFVADFDLSQSVILGEGSFGKVYRAKTLRTINNKPLKEYALKFVETLSEENFQIALKELQFNSLINIHPNVIYVEKVYAWTEIMPFKKYFLVLVMELAIANMRSEVIKRKGEKNNFSESEINRIMEQCLTTFDFLAREKNLYHRDIKPDNLLISQLNPINVKVADFGASKALQNERIQAKLTMQNTLVGTPIFLSPLLYMAYVDGESHNVKHNLEKSDVFSMGLTFLQIILLLSDKQLIQCNDSKFTSPEGTVIDASLDEQNLVKCPGFNKIKTLLVRITNYNVRNCLQGMLQMNEKKRFSWDQALESLTNKNTTKEEKPKQEKKIAIPPNIRQYASQDKNKKIFQSQLATCPMQLMYFDSLAQAKGVNFMLNASPYIIALTSKEVNIYDTNGQSKKVYSNNALFILYFQIENELVGINGQSNIFKINLTTFEQIQSAPIPFVDAKKLTAFKSMRKQLVLASLMDGQMLILDFTQFPPSVIKNFQDHNYRITDFAYEDQQKVLISCDNSRSLFGRLLAHENTFQMQTDYELNNLCFVNDRTLAASATTAPEILVFNIRLYDNSLKIELTKLINQPSHIPQSLTVRKETLVYVSLDELMIFDFKTPELNLVLKGLPFTFQKALWMDDKLIIYDGLNLQKFAIFNSKKTKSNGNPKKKKTSLCNCCCQVF